MARAEGTPMFLRDLATQRVVGANQAALGLLGCDPADLAEVGAERLSALLDPATAPVQATDPSWYLAGPAELVVAHRRPAPAAAALEPLHDRLRNALDRPGAPGETTALLFVDVAAVPVLEPDVARDVDDLVLARLRAVTRRGDLVVRAGGGSFVVLCERVQGEIAAAGIAAAIVDQLGCDLDGSPALPPVSVGLALAGDPGLTPGELAADRDGALAAARTHGRARHATLTSAAVERARQRERLADAMRQGLAAGEFVLHYQPVIDLREGATIEVEALVRWAPPGRGLIGPDRFIPIAEQTGVIVELGGWVLHTACAFAAARPGLAVAVNVSARQVGDDLVARVLDALATSGLEPDRLRLELTETAILDDPDTAVEVLCQLTDLGVRLSHDDFGTGYASLLYLRRLPFDRLKIDRSFIRSIPDTPADRELVAAVLGVARAVGVRVTAEGVETADQARILVDLGCEEAQGFYFGRPMPPEAFDAWWAANTATSSL